MIRMLILSLRMLGRDWRAGELRVLFFAVVIAVTCMTAVGFFAERVRGAMTQQAGELLAADLVMASGGAIVDGRLREAVAQGMRVSQTVGFRSVVVAHGQTHLVEVKAVTQGYPLRGQLRTATRPFEPDVAVSGIPLAGEAWVDPRLLQALSMEVGDGFQLGAIRLRIARVLTYEPDRGGDLFSIAPRVLMNHADVPASRLLLPGSRAEHRLLLAGEEGQIASYRRWLQTRLGAGERLLTVEEGRPELRVALERARRFLGLAALIGVLLSGVAVAMAARHYARRHLDTSALMRCFGSSQSETIAVFVWQILWLGLLAGLVGSVAGYGAQAVLAEILAGLIQGALPAAGFMPGVLGVMTGLIILLGFGLPPLMALRRVPPMRVLRRDLVPAPVRSSVGYFVGVMTMGVLLIWQVQDLKLAGFVLLGGVSTFIVLAAAAGILVWGLGGLRNRGGVTWRFGLANIVRRGGSSIAQIVAFGIGIMVLLLLAMVRGDLLEDWRRSMPQDAPNHFLINVQPDQVAEVRLMLVGWKVSTSGLYPMVRARLTAINGRPVAADQYEDARARRLAHREFNLSWAAQPQPDNRIVDGRWWSEIQHGRRLISLEQGLAKTLGLMIGDEMTFQIAGDTLDVQVLNLREVQWDSFNVNFFAVLPPGVLEEYPASYITSIYLSSQDKPLLARLVKSFPNVTVLDVAALMDKVRDIMDKVNLAMEYVFMFTLFAGLTVLYAALQTTQDERRQEGALLRALGARRGQLWRGLLAEFAILGALAGLLAAVFALLLAYLLAEHVFHFGYHINLWVVVVGVAGGALGIGLAGTLGARRAFIRPPMQILREQ